MKIKPLTRCFLIFSIALAPQFVAAQSSTGGNKVNSSSSAVLAPKIVEEVGFTVAGIAVRTSNAKEATPEGVIGKQWARLFQEGIIAKVPNKADGSLIAVYTDYASDKDGEYTFLVGAKVTSADNLPAGLVARKIPAGRYSVFTSEKGPVPQVVPQTWMRVWATPKAALGGDRAYQADFELYDQRAADPQNAVAAVYVGLK